MRIQFLPDELVIWKYTRDICGFSGEADIKLSVAMTDETIIYVKSIDRNKKRQCSNILISNDGQTMSEFINVPNGLFKILPDGE